jgi:hypothetical protein
MATNGTSRTFEFTVKMCVEVHEPTLDNTGMREECPPAGTNEACDWMNARPAIQLLRALMRDEQRLREYVACEALHQLANEWPDLVNRKWGTIDRNPTWDGRPSGYKAATVLGPIIQQLDNDERSILERSIADGDFGENTELLLKLVVVPPTEEFDFTIEAE